MGGRRGDGSSKEGGGLGLSKEEQVQGRGQGRVGLTGPRDGATCVVLLSFLTRTKRRKMAFFEGCPVGWGGVPTGAGLVDGEVDQDLIPGEGVREGLAWRTHRCRGGVQGLRFPGVSGRGTGPRDGANFATCVVFLSFLTRTKRRKMAFFEGCPVGWG